jgi:hypothetical protein
MAIPLFGSIEKNMTASLCPSWLVHYNTITLDRRAIKGVLEKNNKKFGFPSSHNFQPNQRRSGSNDRCYEPTRKPSKPHSAA